MTRLMLSRLPLIVLIGSSCFCVLYDDPLGSYRLRMRKPARETNICRRAKHLILIPRLAVRTAFEGQRK